MSQDPWKGLREKLEERNWPAVYLFKFIVPADNQKVAQTEALFDSDTAQIELRKSKTGKFVSVSATSPPSVAGPLLIWGGKVASRWPETITENRKNHTITIPD